MAGRWKYLLLGFAIGLVIYSTLLAVRRPHDWQLAIFWDLLFSLNCGNIAVHIARRKGNVESIEDMHRPLSLFPRLPDPPSPLSQK